MSSQQHTPSRFVPRPATLQPLAEAPLETIRRRLTRRILDDVLHWCLVHDFRLAQVGLEAADDIYPPRVESGDRSSKAPRWIAGHWSKHR